MAETISTTYELGDGLKIKNDKLVVDTVDAAEKDNKKPITSHGVAVEVGNLEVLLHTV